MARERNWYLACWLGFVRRWAGVLLRVGALIAVFVAAAWVLDVIRDDGQNRIPVAVGLGAAVVGARFVSSQRKVMKAFASALQQPTPLPLFAVYDRQLRSVASLLDVDAALAEGQCISLALYGYEKEARLVLDRARERIISPPGRSSLLVAEGIVELVCRQDGARALARFEDAEREAVRGPWLPRRTLVVKNIERMKSISQVLTTSPPRDAIAALDPVAGTEIVLPSRLLATWVLALHADRTGNASRAERLWAYLARVAPNCRPFHDARAGGSARAS